MEGTSACQMSEDVKTRSARFRDSESLRFLHPLCSRVPSQRIQALENVARVFDGWLEGYGSPQETVLIDCAAGENNVMPTDYKCKIREQLPDILRFSINAPFTDVRERCSNILQDLQERGMKIPRRRGHGPSHFIPQAEIVPVDTEDDEAQSLYVDAFLHNNRLEHLIQLMGYHPKYLDCFLKTQQYILRGDGPLPLPYRHYIAIMAAGRHQCSYLINIQRTEFLSQDGDERWLNGLEHIPTKLRNLYEINKLMAHRPWLINKSHIEKLLRGEDNWSLSELMQAVVILAQFHALCSFVYGCGINPEIDHEGGHSSRPTSVTDASVVENSSTTVSSSPGLSQNSSHSCTPNSLPEGESCIEQLLQRMRQLTEEAQVEMTQEELLKRFQRVEDQNAELVPVAKQPSPQADILRYVDDADFVYQDFAKRGHTTEIPTFRALDYSWEDQGFSLANRLYSEIGNLLDEKFITTYNLTYNTMGQKANVDTSAFRRAIWNYIHCLFGIRHDDYNYSEVNQLLERPLKNYIKIVTCFPERVSKKDYDSYMREFEHSEKVHINLMLLEARLQGELLYALRAIMKFMT